MIDDKATYSKETLRATINATIAYPKPVINPIATPPKRIDNSSAFALALLNLIRPSATASVAILTAPVVELSKNNDTIETTAVTIIGVKIEVTKNDFVALNLNEAITV